MKACSKAAVVACIAMPMLANADDGTQSDTLIPDEVIVVGRSVETGSARIEVEREILVDTAAAVKNIPGANVNRNGVITGIAQYRGMFGERVAVDIDQLGIISGGPNAMDTPLSYMSPMMTEELVVARGIASVSAAPETIGGYISTKTSRGEFGGRELGVSGVLGTRFSSNGEVSTSLARLTLSNEQHRISAVTQLDDGDDIETPEGTIRPSALSRDRYDVSYAYSDKGRQLLVYAGRLDTGKTGTPALPMDIIVIDTELYGAQASFDVGTNLTLEGRFAYNDVGHLMDNHSMRRAPPPARFRLNTTSGSGSQFYFAGAWEQGASEFLLGIDGIAATHDSVITNPNNAAFGVNNFNAVGRDLIGLFGEWKRPAGSGEIELGLRFKRVDTDAGDVGVTGMMGEMGERVSLLAADFNATQRDLSWSTFDAVMKYRRDISGSAAWNIDIGTKTRAPSYQELYLWLPLQATGGLADGRTYIGNLALNEERSNEIVFGVSASMGRLVISPQAFYRRVDDYIQGIPSTNAVANMVSIMMSGAMALQFANVDAKIWGMDAAWRYDLSRDLFLDGAITVVRGRRTDIDDDLYRLSPFNGSIGLTYSADTWSLRSELIGYAKQDRVSSYNDEKKTPGYWVVNMGFAWNPVTSLRVEARLENLLNESYQDHVTGINRAGGSDIPVGIRLFGAERAVSAGLIYSF
jgi:iron complex outermembrane receptor protein